MSRKKGNIAEDLAKNYLIDNGFKIIDRNYYTKYGEIDIIAIKDSIYHFIEVKSGKNFEPLQNVTNKKLEKIINSIYMYLSNNELDVLFCIDIVVIKNGKIDFISNVSV
ncbi:YraN family protein [Helicobacter sp. MIT 14-3879]|uniref:YraN family protein n=1 Tax=Helicobacter sp. MIT 14-3879 TaxID=2040649 RepID=UPI000E1EB7CB|nr:YraN family protein [Helicobacter sp. MIT 14-3879]RDU63150.1 YraN family protein [Helicobacter sp. MIT 14-3879]